jgi:hypothetical protein
MFTKLVRQICVIGLCLGVCGAANATFHLSQITQLYSNTDGTIQFIELTAYAGGQQFLAGHTITSSQAATSHSFAFPSDLPGDTADMMSDGGYYGGMSTTYKTFVIGTQGFAALGVVMPDYIVPNGFLFTTNGKVTYGEGADTLSYTSLPTDGRLALNRNGTTSVNLPTNFAGATGSVSTAAADYTGAWYNFSESGWGLSVVRGQSGAYGIIMYHYNQAHSPTWYFMSGGTFNGNVYTAPVTLFNGPWLGESFSTIPVTNSPAGTASINFTSDTTATLTYTITGASQVTRNINKLQF